MKKFEQTVGVGWAAAGPVLSGIRHEARRLGLTLQPFPFAKINELVQRVPVIAEGDDAAIDKFAEYVARQFPDAP